MLEIVSHTMYQEVIYHSHLGSLNISITELAGFFLIESEKMLNKK